MSWSWIVLQMRSCIKWTFELFWWFLLVLTQQTWDLYVSEIASSDYGWKLHSFFDQIASWQLQLWSTSQWLFQNPLKWRKSRGWCSFETVEKKNHFLLLDRLTLCLQRQIYSNKTHALNKRHFVSHINGNFVHDLHEI